MTPFYPPCTTGYQLNALQAVDGLYPNVLIDSNLMVLGERKRLLGERKGILGERKGMLGERKGGVGREKGGVGREKGDDSEMLKT